MTCISGKWGARAEEIAAEYLAEHGYAIRERNWRPVGSHLEVDIICQKGTAIVFVEVKARHNRDYDPVEAVDGRKIRRLVRAADIYLRMQEYEFSYRFDIISVSGSEEDFHLDHLEDAFLPPVNF